MEAQSKTVKYSEVKNLFTFDGVSDDAAVKVIAKPVSKRGRPARPKVEVPVSEATEGDSPTWDAESVQA